jgi:YD repeat-containing protein
VSVFDDCIAYWNLDEAGGQTRSDTVGSFHLADASGDVSAYSGQINNGALADGSGSLIASTSPPSTTFGTYGFSMAGWFRILSDANTDTHDILTITLTNSHTMKLTYNEVSNMISMVVSDGTYTSTSPTGAAFPSSGWFFISAQWRGTTFYTTRGTSGTGGGGLSTAALTTGQSLVSVEYEAGTVAVDELGIWDGELTAADIAALYNSGAGLSHIGVFDGCTAYWKCDEATGKFLDSVGDFNLSSSSPAMLGRRTGKIGTYAYEKNLVGSGNSPYGYDTKPADFTAATLSLAGWIRIGTLPTSGSANAVMFLQTTDGSTALRTITLVHDATDDNFYIQTKHENNGTTATVKASTFGAISAATWYHVAIVWDGTSVDLAINATTDSDSAQESTSGCLAINEIGLGYNADVAEAFAFDEWGIWDRALSSAEITSLYKSGDGRSHPDSPAGSVADVGGVALFGFHGFAT